MACQPVEINVPGRTTPNGGLLCTTSGVLFGPLFESIEEANEFCDWLMSTYKLDARQPLHLCGFVQEFRMNAERILQGGGVA